MIILSKEQRISQDDYEKMMEDAASKRTADTKSITEKEGAKASNNNNNNNTHNNKHNTNTTKYNTNTNTTTTI